MGYYAGGYEQGINTIAIGKYAGYTHQGDNAIAIGSNAGYTNQGFNSVAIGAQAGQFVQQTSAVAIGFQAGYLGQQSAAVAIGPGAGQYEQTNGAVAIGSFSGNSGQGVSAVAIGSNAGLTNQGNFSIALGFGAGQTDQTANSIVLNASGSILNSASSGFFVKPLSATNGVSNAILSYKASTNEILVQSGTSKTFVIDHPADPDKFLVHACLEGPEAGVYYRGRGEIVNGSHIEIVLPDYVDRLAKDFTVQITQIYDETVGETILRATELIYRSFKVYGKNSAFYWHVHGKRSDISVEPDKKSVVVQGSGPYKWIQ